MEATIVHSTYEKTVLAEQCPAARVIFFGYTSDVAGTTVPFGRREHVAFVGGYDHDPNVDAAVHFALDVLPLIQTRLPGVKFYAVGSRPPAQVQALEAADVLVTGFVQDLGAVLDRVKLTVAPLRYGAGIKGKIVGSLSHGVPCVASPLAAEGMGLVDGSDVLIADGAVAMAEAVVRLYTDAALWARLSANGLQFVRDHYSFESGLRIMRALLALVGLEVPPPAMAPAIAGPAAAGHLEIAELSGPKASEEYERRVAREKESFNDCLNVHELPDIFHYWANKHLAPTKLHQFGITDSEQFFFLYTQKFHARFPDQHIRMVSVGCGNCDMEARLARRLVDAGINGFAIECLDINESMVARGRDHAATLAVAGHIAPICIDFNQWQPEHGYDIVIANQVLHHVLELETLFAAIKGSLSPEGYFLTSDMIGRNGHQRWPEALQVVQEFWKELPDHYRNNRVLNRYEPAYINHDCSTEGFEGIRAQDILPLLIEYFHFSLPALRQPYCSLHRPSLRP